MASKPSLVVSRVAFFVLAAGSLATACGGSSSTGITPGDASADGASPGGDTGTASGDDGSAGGDDGGTVVTEGGSNPVLDGGDDDGGDDTAPDGGACNTVADQAPAVNSTCSSLEPILAGGALVGGTYYLTGVTTYGTASFCKSGFIPVGIKETAQLALNGTVGTIDSVSQLAATKEHRSTSMLTPGADDASPLTAQTTCPETAGTAQVKYEVRTNAAGKTELVLRLPYAKDEADYVLEKQ